ncbi:hypothetical protein A9O63_14340 [Cereibacter johrii]|nr:hypothetical protein A9O63_14340 [Cereibacter johrii]
MVLMPQHVDGLECFGSPRLKMWSSTMIDELKRFFEDYPRQVLQMRGVSPADLPAGLMDRLLDYRHRQLVNLEDAQYFRIDPAAYWMLTKLISEMKRDGLEELYSQVMLPFSTMMIEIADSEPDQVLTGVVIQIDDAIFTQRFILRKNDVGPSNCAIVSRGLKAEIIYTPTRELFDAVGLPVPDAMIEDEITWNKTFLALAVAIATLLRHDGMLKVEEVSLYPRQTRRQAERSGKSLPDTLISKITLGKAGRGQVEAMKEDNKDGVRQGIPRRTHWVRGHAMRSRSGQIVWRMPHLRGAGPMIKQVRHLTAEAVTDTDDTSDLTNGG